MGEIYVIIGIVVAVAFSLVFVGLNQSVTNNQAAVPSNLEQGNQGPVVQVEASDVPPWKEAGLDHDPNEGEPAAPTPEEIAQDAVDEQQQEEFEAIAARESQDFEIAMADGQIRSELEGAFNVNDKEYLPAEHRDAESKAEGIDQVILYVVSDREVAGDYRSGVTMTHTGIFDLVVEIKDGRVLTYEKVPKPAVVQEIKYNDAELAITEKILQNATIANLLEGKQWYPLFYGHPRGPEYSFSESIGCLRDTCVSVTIRQTDNDNAMIFFKYDTGSERIMRLNISQDW
jgi:hypothetical protein